MITYITGTPGAAKTLWTLQEVEKVRKETGRKVFYWRIPELTLPWEKLADDDDIEGAREKIHQLPEGSIIVTDECHKLFPQRGPSKAVPKYVEMFDEHRHRGHDFYLVTQAPEQVDHFVKYRVGRHVHLKRKFGMERSVVYDWNELADVRDRRAYFDAVKRQFKFPTEFYGVYKSADQHTRTTKPPIGKLAGLAAMPVIGVALAYYAYTRVFGGDEGADVATKVMEFAQAQPRSLEEATEEMRTLWARQFIELVKGQPHSTPFYQSFLVPATIPKIDGCMHVQSGSLDRCQCNTQQGTTITSITHKECLYYVKNGWFDPFEPDQEEGLDGDDDESGTHTAAGARVQAATHHDNPFQF